MMDHDSAGRAMMGSGKGQVRAKRAPRRGGTRVTIADVARAAQVSAMTVSRVMNGDGGVSEARRTMVRQAVGQLGYVPNPAARSLAGAQTVRVAILHDNPSAAFLSAVLMGCLAEATACDAMLVVEQHDYGQSVAFLTERLRLHRIDAVLLPPPLCDDAAVIGALSREGLVLVQLATGRPRADVHAITIDDSAAAHAMTERLIAAGHRRIGFISGDRNQTASALRRVGYEAALTAHGVAVDPALIAEGDYTYRSGLAAAEALLALADRPTALFASNDDMAAAAIAAAHRLMLIVPDDVSVCGFDDSAMATAIWPELTTIHQPVSAMARRAVRLLVDSVRHGAGGGIRHERLDFTLIARGSDSNCARAESSR